MGAQFLLSLIKKEQLRERVSLADAAEKYRVTPEPTGLECFATTNIYTLTAFYTLPKHYIGYRISHFADEELQNLRRKIYGVLFSEHPGKVSVTEHLFAFSERTLKVEYCCREVKFPKRDHVGLLTLWSSNVTPDTQKYELFRRIINEKLDPNVFLTTVKEEFIFPLLAVFYFDCEIRKFAPFELDALLVQSVLANVLPASEVVLLECEPLLRAINLSSWLYKVIEHFQILNSGLEPRPLASRSAAPF